MDISNAQFTSVFNAATEQAKAIVFLHFVDIGISIVIAAIVMGLLTAIAIKFHHRDGDGEPWQNPGNAKLEITWTVIPALILLVLGILTAAVMHLINRPVGSRQPDVIVNAHQWWWEYRYPKSGVVTANELYLPNGADLLLEITSDDVDHSFWVPAFGEKMDAIPGHPNHLFLKPIQPGVFLGSCAEFCGDDHGLMRILASVVSPQEFQAWTQSQLNVPAAPTDATALHGEALFMSKTCIRCHTIAGTAATGRVGPNLTHIADRKTLGSGVIANDIEHLTQWIMDPQQFKPGCHMPQMRISHSDAHYIATYLESLK